MPRTLRAPSEGDGAASAGQYTGMAPAVTIESSDSSRTVGLQEGFLYTDPGDLEADYSDAINNYGAVISNNSIEPIPHPMDSRAMDGRLRSDQQPDRRRRTRRSRCTDANRLGQRQ